MQNLSIPENITRADFIDYDCSKVSKPNNISVQNVVDELSIIEKDMMDTVLDLEEAISSKNQHSIIVENMTKQKTRLEQKLTAVSFAKGVILGWYKV